MTAANQLLWRVNNEYRKRLSQAQTLLNLLEQLLLMQDDASQEHALAVLNYAREQIEAMTEEHRQWRYTYYYDSAETKRMVQDDRAVNQALSRFRRMRAHQERRLNDLYTLIFDVPRPDPNLTRVPNGDLWMMARYAIHDLVTFDSFLSQANPVT
ncbi:MAG: hypothetical protein BroJett038_31260 [Chloroflexota bacterium]|nr:MAG: hypothetical protein BroJett038_31260 [Chloroflexota bacterium]